MRAGAFVLGACVVGALAAALWMGADSAAAAPHARLGVQVQPMTAELREHLGAPRDRGVLVGKVEPNSVAHKSGIEVGDVIVAAGGQAIEAPYDLVKRVALVPAGEELELELVRKGKSRSLKLKLEGPPGPLAYPKEWQEWMEEGQRMGRREMREWLKELERRIDELEKQLHEEREPDDAQRT